jgi:hypothetical protein
MHCAELLDRLGVAASYLALTQQSEIPSGVYECTCGDQSGTKGQQLSSRSLPGSLEMSGSL